MYAICLTLFLDEEKTASFHMKILLGWFTRNGVVLQLELAFPRAFQIKVTKQKLRVISQYIRAIGQWGSGAVGQWGSGAFGFGLQAP